MRILYQGLLRSTASWARVGRGYLKAFLDLGIDVAAVSPRGFLHDPGFPLPAGLRTLTPAEAHRGPAPEVGLGLFHPPQISRIVGRKKVDLFVWEADRVPAPWVEALDRGCDLVVVPSRFTLDALLASGMPSGKVAVVPYGHDLEISAASKDVEVSATSRHVDDVDGREKGTSLPHPRPFTIFTVAAPHERKGIRQLLGAYASSFRRRDDVLLAIKTSYDPGTLRKRSPFEIPSWAEVLTEAGLDRPDAPSVEIDLSRPSDELLLALYDRADLYVQPSWGEGFGLALLDALAAGVPAIATGWGGHMDFFPSGDDVLPYRLVEAGGSIYHATPGARVAIPDEAALAARLSWHRANPAASRGLGARLREIARGWTWRAAAERLLAVL